MRERRSSFSKSVKIIIPLYYFININIAFVRFCVYNTYYNYYDASGTLLHTGTSYSGPYASRTIDRYDDYRYNTVPEQQDIIDTDNNKVTRILRKSTGDEIYEQALPSSYTPSTGTSGWSLVSTSVPSVPEDETVYSTTNTLNFHHTLGSSNYDITYKINKEVATSTYGSIIDGDIYDYESDLQQKVDDATKDKDQAILDLTSLYGEKSSKMMNYFDALFKMIAEKGWVYDKQINDSSNPTNSNKYLNAMLENNKYYVTEVNTIDGKDFDYATKTATNVSKIFQVYDTDAQNVALSKYEAEKADINTKEKQLDVRINKLEAEQDAIKTELESIRKVIDDNVSNTFKIFT